MVKILLLPHNDITPALEDDLRNKLTTIGLALDQLVQVQTPSSQFTKIALGNLEYIEKKLDRFELKNKLPTIRLVLENLSQSNQSTPQTVKLASEDYKYIVEVLDSL